VELRPNYPITTARLRLRPLVLADLDALLAYRSQKEVCRYLPFEPMTREQLVGRLRSDLSRTQIMHEGQALTLGVELAATGELIGDVVLFFRSREHAGGELGYVFHPDFGGQGYATEAGSAMLALAFEQLGLHRVIARLDARNHNSAALAARLGLRLEAHLVQNEMFKGEWSDELDYAMLADEWPQSPAGRIHRGRPPLTG
jgi:RimJ/RimL family protein N-acetyltransferase